MAKSQREKFEEAARELDADGDGDAFEIALAKVAKAPKLSDAEIKALAKQLRESKRG